MSLYMATNAEILGKAIHRVWIEIKCNVWLLLPKNFMKYQQLTVTDQFGLSGIYATNSDGEIVKTFYEVNEEE